MICTVRLMLSKRQILRRFATAETVEEAAEQINKWQKYTAGMITMALAVALFNAYSGSFTHHKHQTRQDLEYLHIRNKPYPWKCNDCSLFDLECWKQCREEEKRVKNGKP